MSKTTSQAAEFAATKVKDKNRQPDNDIFFAAKEGYEKGAEDMKQKAIETYKNTCSFSPEGCCMMKKKAGKCDCDNLNDFIEELNS